MIRDEKQQRERAMEGGRDGVAAASLEATSDYHGTKLVHAATFLKWWQSMIREIEAWLQDHDFG